MAECSFLEEWDQLYELFKDNHNSDQEAFESLIVKEKYMNTFNVSAFVIHCTSFSFTFFEVVNPFILPIQILMHFLVNRFYLQLSSCTITTVPVVERSFLQERKSLGVIFQAQEKGILFLSIIASGK